MTNNRILTPDFPLTMTCFGKSYRKIFSRRSVTSKWGGILIPNQKNVIWKRSSHSIPCSIGIMHTLHIHTISFFICIFISSFFCFLSFIFSFTVYKQMRKILFFFYSNIKMIEKVWLTLNLRTRFS